MEASLDARHRRWGGAQEENAATSSATFAFERLTLCPIDTRCIEASLLREDERAWLNEYHATVRERLAPRTVGAARDWLLARTATV